MFLHTSFVALNYQFGPISTFLNAFKVIHFQTPKDLNVSVYDFLPSSVPSTPPNRRPHSFSDAAMATTTTASPRKERLQRTSTKRNPLVRQMAEERKEEERRGQRTAAPLKTDSFDMYQSVTR